MTLEPARTPAVPSHNQKEAAATATFLARNMVTAAAMLRSIVARNKFKPFSLDSSLYKIVPMSNITS